MTVCSFVFSGIVGSALTANAANTTDRRYVFNNANEYGYSDWRDKTDDSKVYVHPTSGPDIYYVVMGANSTSTTTGNLYSNTHLIKLGIQASITNTVNESDRIYARLRFRRKNASNVSTQGVWSPDSTQNYTVYN